MPDRNDMNSAGGATVLGLTRGPRVWNSLRDYYADMSPDQERILELMRLLEKQNEQIAALEARLAEQDRSVVELGNLLTQRESKIIGLQNALKEAC